LSESKTGIITSAAYLGSELEAEFGKIPPSFLPIGHQRLYQIQYELLRPICDRIVLTLPEGFSLPKWDSDWLASKNVELIFAPEMSLGASVQFAIAASHACGTLRVLHGDTIFLSALPGDVDLIAVMPGPSRYEWGAVDDKPRSGRSSVLAGYFSFSSAVEFGRQLTISRDDFLRAVNEFARQHSSRMAVLSGWADCGHLQTYYNTRSTISIARSFNALQSDGLIIKKSSTDIEKMDAEASWFEQLPPSLRVFTPQYIGREKDGYALSFELSPTLHELYIFGALQGSAWGEIFEACSTFLEASATCAPLPCAGRLGDAVAEKTKARLEKWFSSSGYDWDQRFVYAGKKLPPLHFIVDRCVELTNSHEGIPAFVHGDFCFTNTFYDFRYKRVKVIDPKGAVSGSNNIADLRYDLAKLRHSLEGYDQILAGRFSLTDGSDMRIDFHSNGSGIVKEICSDFRVKEKGLYDNDITALTITLFLSMIPLHSDRPDRQSAFFANALRMYSEMEDFL